jgi:polyisoprenoid-binding protein YceI
MASAGQVTGPAVQELQRDGALAGEWTLDPSRTAIGLRTRSMWGLTPVKGVFGEVSGKGTVSPDGTVRGTLTVAAASIGTRNKRRDTHLRSPEFFDADAYPDITFTVNKVQISARGAAISGDLTVRSRTRPLSFEARVSSSAPDEVRLDAEVKVNRADFGLTWNQMGMASMDNTITVRAVFTRA